MTQYRVADPWVPVRWSKGCGWVIFEGEFEAEGYFYAVGPRIPTPDEPWVTVPHKWTPEMSIILTRALGQEKALYLWADWPMLISSMPKP